MYFHTIYFTVLIVGFIFFYTLKHRNNQNKFHLNYLILFFASLLVATLIYSICVYKNKAVNFSVIFYFIVLHLIFFYKYLELFLNQKRKKSIYLYAPIIIFAIMSAFELSGYNLFLIGNKAIKTSNKFDLLKGSKGLILTAIAITSYYIFIISIQLNKSLVQISDSSNRNKLQKNWFVFLYLYVTITFFSGAVNIIIVLFDLQSYYFIYDKTPIIIIAVIIFFYLRHFTKILNFENNLLKSTVVDEQIYLKILSAFNDKKLYLASNYNLNDLALEIKITPKRIISLIYSFESLTVNDFLNKHRIEFAKEKISEGYLSRFSIEALYLESGFKSAQTFYRTFKKFEGITPKEYANIVRE